MRKTSDRPRRFRFLGGIIHIARALLLSAFLANVASAVPPVPPTVEVPADQFLSVPEPVPFVSDDGAWCDVAVVDGVPWAYAIKGRTGEESARVGVFAKIRAVPSSTAGRVAIPASFEGAPVTAIDGMAFYGCDRLVSVVVPDGVESIGDYAFYGCTALESVSLPESATNIAENAFEGCPFLFKSASRSRFGAVSSVPSPSNRTGPDAEDAVCVVTFNANGERVAAAKADAPWQPVYRFYSKNYKGHFYTIDPEERATLMRTNPNWKYEGVAYYAAKTRLYGTVPVYRFFSKNYRGHFYTIDEEEMQTVRDTNPNWRYEGVAFYVYPTRLSDPSRTAAAIYRFWSKGYRHHFFTVDEDEMRMLRETNPNWKYEGVAFYAYKDAPSDSSGGLYMVVDLSGGPSATSYPVAYLTEPPSRGFNTDEYKTTKLVLRCLKPGPIPTRDATITRPFYVGLFEVTQRQWELVMGTRPSYFSNASYYATRPVEQVSYNMIRGGIVGWKWPESNAVDSGSFLDKLRARTGLEFDLPTEAQWEYACRAGTETDYNSGKNYTERLQDSAMDEVGRYWFNGGSGGSSSCSIAGGTATVGSYRPNFWGLYDMHGNVSEWCLDWGGSAVSGNDPVGSSSGDFRVLRGGNWGYTAKDCISSCRDGDYPQFANNGSGFRLARPLVQE